MGSQNIYFVCALIATLFLMVLTSTVPDKTKTEDFSKKDNDHLDIYTSLGNPIVLIALNETSKGFGRFGVIPIAETDVDDLFNTESTDQLKTITKKENDDVGESRVLPLVSTTKKALLLFSLHEALLKTNKVEYEKTCVIISKDDLAILLNTICGTMAMKSSDNVELVLKTKP